MRKNKKFTLPMKCSIIESEKMIEIYGGKRNPLQDVKEWLSTLIRKKK